MSEEWDNFSIEEIFSEVKKIPYNLSNNSEENTFSEVSRHIHNSSNSFDEERLLRILELKTNLFIAKKLEEIAEKLGGSKVNENLSVTGKKCHRIK